MNENTQLQKYSSLSLTKVQNRLTITDRLLTSSQIAQLKKSWKEKLDVLEKQEKWEELLIDSEICIKKLPEWEYSYYYRGTALLYSMHLSYTVALNDFNKAIELNSKFAKAYCNRGWVKMQTFDIHEAIKAIEDFTISIELESNNTMAYYGRGLAKRLYQKDYYGALNDYCTAIELDITNFRPYHSRASLKKELKDYIGALEDYNKILELCPYDIEAYYDRGGLKFDLHDYKGAINDYNAALELGEEDIYFERGLAKYSLEDYTGAIHDFTKAIEIIYKDDFILSYGLDSFHELAKDYYHNRGMAKEKLGDAKGALEDKKKAEELNNRIKKK